MKAGFGKGLRKYSVNTGYLFLEKFIRIAVTLTAWTAVIRYLGPERYGIFSYAFSFVYLFQVIAELGLNSIVVRDLVKNRDSEDRILGTAFLLKLYGAVLAVVSIFVVSCLFSFDPYSKTIVFIISLRMIFYAFNSVDYYFQSHVMSKYPVYAQIMSLVVTSVLCVTFVYLKKPLVYFAYVVALEAFVLSVGLVFAYRLNTKKPTFWQFDQSIAIKLLKNSVPLILMDVFISVYMRIDQIMIKNILGAQWTGYYAASVQISEAFYFIPMVIANSLFPAIVTAKIKSEELYYKRLQLLFTLLLWTSIILSVGISIIAEPLVRFLFGQQYILSVNALIINVWAGVFVFMGVANSKWAVNENLQALVAIYAALGAVINIVLNIILIPVFSIEGAAIASVISYFIAGTLGNILSRKTRKMFFLQVKSINFIPVFKKKFLSTGL